MNTYTYFAQAIVNVATRKVEKYELLLRAWSPQTHEWYLPNSFDISVGMQTRMLKEALKDLEVKRVGINLTPEQFASRGVVQRLARFVAQTPELIELTVELTTAPTLTELSAMAPEYHQHGILIALDDVGSDIDDLDLAAQLAPNVDIFKFALQNLREQGHTDDLLGRCVHGPNWRRSMTSSLRLRVWKPIRTCSWHGRRGRRGRKVLLQPPDRTAGTKAARICTTN